MSSQRSESSDFSATRPVVFYDGACPLCCREIAHYRRIDKAHRLCWVDAAVESEALHSYGLTPERAMTEMHVLDTDGNWQRGVDAFLIMWVHLPTYPWLSRLITVLRLRRPLGFLYRHFAAWRYRRRCEANSCQVPRATRGK